MSKKWSFAYLFLPIAGIIFLDVGFTIKGNLPYFLDKTNMINEVSPVGRAFIAMGPAEFVVASLFYLAVIFILLHKMPQQGRLVLFFSMIVAHGNAGFGWLNDSLKSSICSNIPKTIGCTIEDNSLLWTLSVLTAISFGIICAWCVKSYFAKQSSPDP